MRQSKERGASQDKPAAARGNPAVEGPTGGSHLGFWAGLLTAVLAAAALALAVTTPPRSGPYCQSACIGYPYTEAASFVPRDYLWMYPALLAPLAFTVLAACLHSWTPARWRHLSLTGTCLAAVGAAILVVDYGLQLSVMQPSLLAGETSGLSLLSQYNPHGVFIGLENIGYGTIALALIFLGMPLAKSARKPARAAGWVFAAGGGVTLLLLAVFAVVYSSTLDYRFEVIALLLSYLVLAAAGTLLAASFSPWRVMESAARVPDGDGP